MAEEERPAGLPEARAVPRRRVRPSLVWIVPIVAAAAGAWVAAVSILGQGPEIAITFHTAEGLEAGKTKIKYNGVEVGTLEAIRLSDDHRRVVATARMQPGTEDFLVDGTHFWVVRPRISGASISGLGTLISGAYVGMEIGHATGRKRDFVALETPPVVTIDTPGRFYALRAADMGSLDVGTPIFFRRIQVGEVSSYEMAADGSWIDVKVFVKAPYDRYVGPDTRFWQASGIDVSLTASGLNVETESLLSILIGGIAFETPAGTAEPLATDAQHVFPLFKDRAEAFKVPPVDVQRFVLFFTDSVRGLAAGAPVEFRGIPIGEVASVDAQVDATTFEFTAPVTIQLDARRLGVKIKDLPAGVDFDTARERLIDALVARGVRAQLRTASLLTGALYVSFDFYPDAPPASVDWSRDPVRLPTTPGNLESLEARIRSIIKKVDELPLAAIGNDVRKTIAELDLTLASARTTLQSADRLVQPDSALGGDLAATLQEVNRAARSLRVLTDYLERHPESLIRGKSGGPQ